MNRLENNVATSYAIIGFGAIGKALARAFDVTNAYGVPLKDMGGLPSARFVAQAFTGAKLVKGFNH